jgi:hypothetical protein
LEQVFPKSGSRIYFCSFYYLIGEVNQGRNRECLSETNNMTFNPHEASLANKKSNINDINYEQIRSKYIKHEASVKSISVILYSASILSCTIGISQLQSQSQLYIYFFIAAIALIVVGILVKKLHVAGRFLAVISLISLWFLISKFILIILLYLIYLLFSKRGNMVFSEYYKEVIEATPQYSCKTSIFLILGLPVPLLAFLALMLYQYLF